MQNNKLIHEFQISLIEIYNNEGLNCLRDLNEEDVFEGKGLTSYFCDVVGKVKSNKDCFRLINEFIFISDEILFFTGQLYFYRPFINNPLEYEYVADNNFSLYVNYQNYASKRYFMYTDIVFEKIYNFWNRIGNLISLFFLDNFNKRENVYFSNSIDKVSNEFHDISEYQFLKNYREHEFSILNRKRKDIVHNFSLDTIYKETHIENISDKQVLEKWFEDIVSFADYFKTEIEFTLKGIKNTLIFLDIVQKRKEKTPSA